MHLILDRCPTDAVAVNFHLIIDGQLKENLWLRVRHRLSDLKGARIIEDTYRRLEAMGIVAKADHRLFAKRLLELQSWPSAILALRETDDVDVSAAINQFIAEDPHLQLDESFSTASHLSMLSALLFYALTGNRAVLQTMVPMCAYTSKEISASALIGSLDQSVTVRRDS